MTYLCGPLTSISLTIGTRSGYQLHDRRDWLTKQSGIMRLYQDVITRALCGIAFILQ